MYCKWNFATEDRKRVFFSNAIYRMWSMFLILKINFCQVHLHVYSFFLLVNSMVKWIFHSTSILFCNLPFHTISSVGFLDNQNNIFLSCKWMTITDWVYLVLMELETSKNENVTDNNRMNNIIASRCVIYRDLYVNMTDCWNIFYVLGFKHVYEIRECSSLFAFFVLSYLPFLN